MMPFGRKSKCFSTSLAILSSAILPVPKVSTIRLTGPRDSDRVGDLHFAAARELGGDDVLGDVARGVCRRAIDLGRVLAGEGAAAVPRRTAVAVDDDLATGEAGVAHGTADHETPGRIDQKLGIGRSGDFSGIRA